jgi:Ran GTPase-activating protein (RanGAP) involved in mRNA processing and transport
VAAEAAAAPEAAGGNGECASADDALDALCAHVEMSREQLLAADSLWWEEKGIGAVRQRVQGLAVLLARSASLTVLDLDGNSPGAEGARTLAGGLEGNTTLATLNLRSNGLGDVGAAALARVLPSVTELTALYLHSNQIGDVGVAALAGALPSLRRLTQLDLHNNGIGDAGRAQLEAAKGPQLTDLLL